MGEKGRERLSRATPKSGRGKVDSRGSHARQLASIGKGGEVWDDWKSERGTKER